MMRSGRLKDKGSVFMGRSFSISLVTKSRIGASLNLSRIPQGRTGRSIITNVNIAHNLVVRPVFILRQDAGATFRIDEGAAMPAHGDNGTVSSPFTNFDTIPYSSGAGVESTPPALYLSVGEKKEM